jgi:hypothetical protein
VFLPQPAACPPGHLIVFRGGDLPGFHIQVSFMPQDHIGVIVFEIGNHSQPLYNVVTYNVYERLLGMDQTPCSQLEIRFSLVHPGQPAIPLIRVKGLTFRSPRFANDTFEFIVQDGQVKGVKEKDPSRELTYPKK